MRKVVEVTPGFFILWALLLLVLPLRLIAAAMAAAMFHELCHWAVIRLLGGQVMGVTIGAGGMVMETLPMPPWQELLCALAGPVGSFLLVLLHRTFPLLSLCALAQGAFNLLPLYPMDGGRALSCILSVAGKEHWLKWIEGMALAVLLILAVRMGPGAMMVWGMIALRKIPCKAGRFGVQ